MLDLHYEESLGIVRLAQRAPFTETMPVSICNRAQTARDDHQVVSFQDPNW